MLADTGAMLAPRRSGRQGATQQSGPTDAAKQAGIGREFGLDGIVEYAEVKHVHVDQVDKRGGEGVVRRALRRRAACACSPACGESETGGR